VAAVLLAAAVCVLSAAILLAATVCIRSAAILLAAAVLAAVWIAPVALAYIVAFHIHFCGIELEESRFGHLEIDFR